ncbi:MAG: c-type cytochrome domain-containing protein, partial [Verrucomicrobiota bacterium]|nr:c-type cytochrome domain-containing protein [Verrucomicrobiota bacterium]
MTILRNFLLSVVFVTGADSLADEYFEKSVRPFLKTYCIACHGEETQKGKIRLDHLSSNLEDRQEAELWARSLEAIEFGEMPSDKADKFPTKAEARLVQDWIARSLAQVGIEVEEKAGKEGYGNLIPHDLLFSPAESKRVVDAAARLWRISPKALANTVRGARMVSNPFALDKPHGNFRDFKGKYVFNSLMAEQVTELALAHSQKEAKNARKAIVMM